MQHFAVGKRHAGKGPRTKKQRVAMLLRFEREDLLERQRRAYERNLRRLVGRNREI